MKIFTNVQNRQVAGVASSLSSFIDSVTKNHEKDNRIIGMDFIPANAKSQPLRTLRKFKYIQKPLDIPSIKDALTRVNSIEELKAIYKPVIESYKNVLISQAPDFALINGTYFLPWCLLLAAKETGVPAVIHYHGSITKETEHWQKKQRDIFRRMEETFDAPNNIYIFPSKLALETVEQEVFKHKVAQYLVLPNPIPSHFFKKLDRPKNNLAKVGIIGRWDKIKNVAFSQKLAQYNYREGGHLNYNIITDLNRNPEAKKSIKSIMRLHKPFDHREMAGFYNKMNVVISPSHFETYGNVAQESLACGTPALISPNMGVAETFRKVGLDKWIINFDSVKDVHAKIEELSYEIVPDDVRKELQEKYSPAVIHAKMLNVFNA